MTTEELQYLKRTPREWAVHLRDEALGGIAWEFYEELALYTKGVIAFAKLDGQLEAQAIARGDRP